VNTRTMSKQIVVAALACLAFWGGHTPARAQSAVALGGVSASDPRTKDQLLSRRATIDVKRVSLKHALDVVSANTGVFIEYQTQVLDAYATPVSAHLVKVPLRVVLDRLLAHTTLGIVAVNDGLTIVELAGRSGSGHRATGSIAGTVTDPQTKRPIVGATVLLDDATRGTKTDAEGRFRVPGVSAGTHRMTVRMMSYRRKIGTVIVTDGETTTYDVALEAGVNTLEDVVVTGTVIPTELKAVPNAITVITAKQIEERGITHIDQLFRGDVPGLFAQNSGSGNATNAVIMFSRGATALSYTSAGTFFGTNPIKTYVDGVEMADPMYLSQIDPHSIERIEIISGPQASTIYGSNAINGVMQIFTKRGITSQTQLTLNLLSGWVENNVSTARTPQHDYSGTVSGVEGRVSYNAGGSWNYMGQWSPAAQVATTGGFGGARFALTTPLGPVTADVTLRRTNTNNRSRGSIFQTDTRNFESGLYWQYGQQGVDNPTTNMQLGQTLGLTMSYAPTSWWSHELGIGQDVEDGTTSYTAAGYRQPYDTVLYFRQVLSNRRSVRYTSTARVTVTSLVQATVTVGADGWQNLSSEYDVWPQTLTGPLSGSMNFQRQPGHNTGGFLQASLGLHDQLFLTYGLRAEWNPNFGAEAQPNYAPRYGVAYSQELGIITARVRASYGRSTRPPASGLKDRIPCTQNSCVPIGLSLSDYGSVDRLLANPALAPEHQQGGEGGLELYVGTRGSLSITRYNQTVDGLIALVRADSVQRIDRNPDPFGYCVTLPFLCGYGAYLTEFQNLNVGSIRNQGWELTGSIITGPFTTRGTYSWTKSRTIGVDSRYRAVLTEPQYKPGATFDMLPEHTLAADVTYAHAGTSVGLHLTRTGPLRNQGTEFEHQYLTGNLRLQQNLLRMDASGYVRMNAANMLADVTASHQLSPRVEGFLQVQNFMNHFENDNYAGYASLGRQSKGGLRLRLQ